MLLAFVFNLGLFLLPINLFIIRLLSNQIEQKTVSGKNLPYKRVDVPRAMRNTCYYVPGGNKMLLPVSVEGPSVS